MADKSINDLTQAQQLLDSGLLVVYQGGETQKLLASTLKNYVAINVVNASATTLTPGAQATASFNPTSKVLTLGIPAGTNATITATHYASSNSGTTTPSSGWRTTIPSMSGGQYLWTRLTWSTGQYSYIVARQGVDGTGAVTSFNGRAGAVVPAANDYSASQISGLESYVDGRINAALGNVQNAINAINEVIG